MAYSSSNDLSLFIYLAVVNSVSTNLLYGIFLRLYAISVLSLSLSNVSIINWYFYLSEIDKYFSNFSILSLYEISLLFNSEVEKS